MLTGVNFKYYVLLQSFLHSSLMSNSLGLNLSATEVSVLGTAREENVNFFNMSDDEVEDTCEFCLQ